MLHAVLTLCLCGVWLSVGPAAQAPSVAPAADPAKPNVNAIELAVAALGAADLQTIKYSASGNVSASDPSEPIRGLLTAYEVAIDYPASAMQVEIAAGPGAAAAEDSTRIVQAVNGEVAWDVTLVDVRRVQGDPPHGVAPAASRSKATRPALTALPPQLNAGASAERRQKIWVTPHGFLKAALANQPALRPAGSGTEVSFFAGTRRYVGFINSRNQVERVRTWIARPAGDDLLIDTLYTDYAKFGPSLFPSRIRQTQGGQQALDVTVTAVRANARVQLSVPDGLR